MNEIFRTFNSALITTTNSIVMGVVQFFPKFLGAVIVFIVGVVLAGWAKAIITRLLKALQFSKLAASDSVQKFLSQAQITQTIETVFGEIVRVIIILIFSVSAINLLGLTTVTQVLSGILAYIPNIVGAVIILVIGVLIAGVVEKLIKGSLGSIDIKMGRAMAKLASYTVVVFTALAALSQLGIAQSFVNTIFIGFITMLALGMGLSLGLGSKDLVRTLLENWYKNIQKDIE